MKFDWNVMVLLFGIIQSIFIFYIFSKAGNKNHLQFGAWLSILLFFLIESFMIRSGAIQYALHLFKVPTPFLFLLGPLLYGYTNVHVGHKTNRAYRLLHFVPFVFYAFYLFNFFLQSSAYKHNIIAKDFHPDWHVLPVTKSFSVDPWNINGWIFVELIVLHLAIYIVLSLRKIIRNKHIIAKQKNWLLYLNSMMAIAVFILFFSQGGVINGTVFLESPFPDYSSDIFITFVIYVTMFYIIIKPDIFKAKDKKYKKSSLSASYKKQKLAAIRALIENEKLYLSEKFSMKILSEKSGLSKHHISQILNEELRYTFFQLTNEYRINEAKRRLDNPKGYIKIEHLAHDLGYKSKSTFFSEFKKATQLTPTQYRNHSS